MRLSGAARDGGGHLPRRRSTTAPCCWKRPPGLRRIISGDVSLRPDADH
ncbi:MAG: hypothetical protein MZW92_80760 [Comamonadaceae bacterium]|nr:hypothetical protein [Comamonadaceae bacterium]